MLIKKKPDTEKWALLVSADAQRAANDLNTKSASQTAEITSELGVSYMVEVVCQLRTDAAADMIRGLPADFAAQVIAALPLGRRNDLKEILSYPDGVVGAMMSKECLFVPAEGSVADAIEYLHLFPQEKKVRNPYVYVVDADRKLIGAIETQDLVLNSLDRPVREIMRTPVEQVVAVAPKSLATKIIQESRQLALPVVDAGGRLVGVISPDNAIQAVRDQADRDIAHIIGTDAEEMKSQSVPKIMRLRLPWLLFSVASGLFCTFITEAFQHGGNTLAVLFVFIPVLLGLAESTGIQGATIIVRKITFGDVSGREIWMLFMREAVIGILVGVVCGIIVGVVTSYWQGNPLLGFAIAVSMQFTILISAIVGLALPLVFRTFRVDPAAASGPLVLAVCDILTLFIYFNLANFILTR